jgi:hypothetical protein
MMMTSEEYEWDPGWSITDRGGIAEGDGWIPEAGDWATGDLDCKFEIDPVVFL